MDAAARLEKLEEFAARLRRQQIALETEMSSISAELDRLACELVNFIDDMKVTG